MTNPPAAATFCRVLPALGQTHAMGESLGHLAHDFNNLLAAIAGSASLIEMGGAQSAHTLRHVRNIHSATNRGARIMQQLLTLSPRTDAPFEPSSVDELLRDAKTDAERLLGPAYTVTCFAPEGLAPFTGDRRQLLMVIATLVENARDAMPQGGAIVTAARARSLAEFEAEAAGVAAGEYLALTVQDAGPGVAASAAERIGEPFFTTKPKGKGTGLGLATVNRIARRHSGFVMVDSEAGAGTRVTCHFRLGLCAGP